MDKKLEPIFRIDSPKGLKPLFIFEMANNHNGDVKHGLRIIREIHEICKGYDFLFAFKLQYRDLDSFIHPAYKGRQDIKFVKRFSDTRLTGKEFKTLKQEIDKLGFISICTPFDEKSVDLIEEHGFDAIKIASCSLTDWPLLERIVQSEKPIIASTAGNTLDDIDKVVTFFTHRGKSFCLMHCVAEYPTEKKNLQLGQIDLLKARYERVNIGYSTHESPDNLNPIRVAIAKGATIFEKHVALGENRNAYSATPEGVRQWLEAAKEAIEVMGLKGERVPVTEKEKEDLRQLRRAVFAKKDISSGERIDESNVFYAIPSEKGQILANDMSKYAHYYAKKAIKEMGPVLSENAKVDDIRAKVDKIAMGDIKDILKKANLPLPNVVDLEISHHYGIDKFYSYGCTIINVVNRDYCKKFIIVLGGQENPFHLHKIKEESFVVSYGDITVNIDGAEKEYKRGDIILVKKGERHSFSSKKGGIFEEISTTHYKGDSYYDDDAIMRNSDRKTCVKLWLDN